MKPSAMRDFSEIVLTIILVVVLCIALPLMFEFIILIGVLSIFLLPFIVVGLFIYFLVR